MSLRSASERWKAPVSHRASVVDKTTRSVKKTLTGTGASEVVDGVSAGDSEYPATSSPLGPCPLRQGHHLRRTARWSAI